jgi:FecR protein
MNNTLQFRPTVLLLAMAAAWPLPAHAAAGVAQFTAGEVSVTRGRAANPLTKGSPVESGDAITTGSQGQAQIRFTDGGLVAIQPNSLFNIRNYADANDPKKDGFLVDLLRGGMRAITGLIGKRNRDNYKVITSTATVGIRGSAFFLAYNPDGSLSVANEQDEIEVCTNAGCVGLTVGEAARVTSNATLPVRTNARVSLPIPPLLQDPLIAGNQANPSGTSLIVPASVPVVPPVLPPAPINATLTDLQMAFMNGGGDSLFDGFNTIGNNTTVDPITDAIIPANDPTVFVASQVVSRVDTAGALTVAKTGTAAGSFGTVGAATDPDFIGWGYWVTGQKTSGSPPASPTVANLVDVHYIVGRPTPSNEMPLTGTAGYSLIGGSAPTATLSGVTQTGTLLPTSSLSADFSIGTVQVDIRTQFGASTLAIQGPAFISGSTFSAEGNGPSIRGLFTGTLAARAGLVYGQNDPTLGRIAGSAVFGQTSASGLSTVRTTSPALPANAIASPLTATAVSAPAIP